MVSVRLSDAVFQRKCMSKKYHVRLKSPVTCTILSSPKPATAHAVGAEQFSINYSTSLINFIVPADK